MAQGQAPLVTVQYYGDSGGSTTYYYFVQTIYPWGRGPISAAAGATVLSLGHNNVVSVNWTPMPGATSYDVLRNTTGTQPSGTSNVAIATNLATADGLVDNGLPAFSYTVQVATGGPLMVDPQAEQQKAKADADKINKENDEALKKYEEEKKKQDEVDQKSVEKAKKANELYEAGIKLDTPSHPKTPAEQAASESKSESAAHKSSADAHKKEPELVGASSTPAQSTASKK